MKRVEDLAHAARAGEALVVDLVCQILEKSMSAAAMPCSFSTSSVRMSFTANWRVSTVTLIGKLPN